jgi:hypothetical protein
VLVHDFVDVVRPVMAVEAALTGAAQSDFGVWAEAAYRRGELLAVGPGEGTLKVTVELEVGEPIRGSTGTTIPLTWRAAGATSLFPMMEAELVLTPLGPDLTHVTFRGSYDPPLSGFGAVLDRIALHRVAESTVRSFLQRLAAALEGITDAAGR